MQKIWPLMAFLLLGFSSGAMAQGNPGGGPPPRNEQPPPNSSEMGERNAGQVRPGSRIPASRIRLPRQRASMREIYELRPSQTKVERFEAMDGQPPFILDTSGVLTLFRYERGGEVLILKQVHTTRGDTIFKNDQGAVVLRRHRVGSATLFPGARSRGVMAWTTGSARPLGPPKVTMAQMTDVLSKIADQLAEALDQDLSITVNGANEENAWVFLDAANNVLAGVKRTMRLSALPQNLSDIRQIEISKANRPSSSFEGEVLRLLVNPKKGFAGRLSSLQVQRTLTSGKMKSSFERLPQSLELSVQPVADNAIEDEIAAAPVETGAQIEVTQEAP